MRHLLFAFVVLAASRGVLAAEPAAGPESAEQTAQALAVAAEVLAGEGKLDEAILLYRKVHERDPAPILLYNIARLLDRKGDLHEAHRAYQRYLLEEKDEALLQKGRKRLADLEQLLPSRLIVRPEPPDAWILVDKSAARPGEPFEVTLGWHYVVVEAKGYEPETLHVEIGLGPDRELPVKLTPLPGGLAIISSFPGAEVVVDGESLAVTPVRGPIPAEAGPHTVRLLVNGVERFAQAVEVKPGETLTLVPKLEAGGGEAVEPAR